MVLRIEVDPNRKRLNRSQCDVGHRCRDETMQRLWGEEMGHEHPWHVHTRPSHLEAPRESIRRHNIASDTCGRTGAEPMHYERHRRVDVSSTRGL